MPELEGTIRRNCNLCDEAGQMRFYIRTKKSGHLFYCGVCWKRWHSRKEKRNMEKE